MARQHRITGSKERERQGPNAWCKLHGQFAQRRATDAIAHNHSLSIAPASCPSSPENLSLVRQYKELLAAFAVLSDDTG